MKLYDLLTSALKLENDFIDNRGELKTQVVIGRAMSGDETLLRRLLTTETLNAEFFREVAGCVLFDCEQFINFLQQLLTIYLSGSVRHCQKQFCGSFTHYRGHFRGW